MRPMRNIANLFIKFSKLFGMFIAVTLILSWILLISWISTCGIVKLITICFNCNFSWSIATGVWLILMSLQSAVSYRKK